MENKHISPVFKDKEVIGYAQMSLGQKFSTIDAMPNKRNILSSMARKTFMATIQTRVIVDESGEMIFSDVISTTIGQEIRH